MKEAFDSHRGGDPQIEIHCFKWPLLILLDLGHLEKSLMLIMFEFSISVFLPFTNFPAKSSPAFFPRKTF